MNKKPLTMLALAALVGVSMWGALASPASASQGDDVDDTMNAAGWGCEAEFVHYSNVSPLIALVLTCEDVPPGHSYYAEAGEVSTSRVWRTPVLTGSGTVMTPWEKLSGSRLNEPTIARKMAGAFELESTTRPGTCVDIWGGTAGKGVPVITFQCNGGMNQRFSQTAAGELRSPSGVDFCLDIEGGKAKAGAKVHTWKCHGGSTQKWFLRLDGKVSSQDGPTFCLSRDSETGAQMTVEPCGNGLKQPFSVRPVN